MQLDENPWQIGKNYPVEVGLIGDVQSGLVELNALLSSTLNESQRSDVRARTERHAKRIAAARAELRSQLDRERAERPLTALTLADTIGRVLPANAALIEEAVTTTEHRIERLGLLKNTDGYFATVPRKAAGHLRAQRPARPPRERLGNQRGHRPGTHEWFLRNDLGHTIRLTFGGPGDVPVPAAFP